MEKYMGVEANIHVARIRYFRCARGKRLGFADVLMQSRGSRNWRRRNEAADVY